MATILLVDDISFIKRVEKKVLEEHGHSIIGDASDGEQAIALYEQTNPDIVLMDITMPKLSGIQALEAILAKHANAKIIMCSAMAHRHILYKAVKAGAKDYLIKPYTMEHLLDAISKVLNHP